MSIETLTFPNNITPLDLLLYRQYGAEIPGLVEATLAQNPGLAALGPFPPTGTVVNVTTPSAQSSVAAQKVTKLYD